MKKEIICINIGQAGVQISNAVWELLCIEHGLDASGNLRNNIENQPLYNDNYDLRTFFCPLNGNKFSPRAINVDLEPTVIDEIRCGPYRNLWNPSRLITSLEDAANNWARGRYTIGKRVSNRLIHEITRISRECLQLHGFMIIYSLGGGTGSGVGTLLLDHLEAEFSKFPRMVTVVNPAPRMSSALVEPYNAVLATANSLIGCTDLVITCDNEALYSMCTNNLQLHRPTFNNLNRILSLLFSSFTVNFRFPSASLDHDLGHLQTNLVPFPRVHFPFANYSPLFSLGQKDHLLQTVSGITKMLFEPSSQMVQCNTSIGKNMTCCLQYRGLVTPKEIYSSLTYLKQTQEIQFVNWCPTGFKVGVSPVPPGSVPNIAHSIANVVMFSNNTAIEQIWRHLLRKFNLLYDKKSFLHWYVGEGMEEGEFKESRNAVNELQNDYFDLNNNVYDDVNPNNYQFQSEMQSSRYSSEYDESNEVKLMMTNNSDRPSYSGYSHTFTENSDSVSHRYVSGSGDRANQFLRNSSYHNDIFHSLQSTGLNNAYVSHPELFSNFSSINI